jgi:hypothetical protein
LLDLESAFLAGEPKTCRKVIGLVVAIGLSIKFLPLFEILTVCLRTLFLFLLFHMSVLVPIRRRLPLLFPGINARFRNIGLVVGERVVLPIRAFFGKRLLKINAVSKGEEDVWSAHISSDDWMGLCKDWVRKKKKA